MRDWLRQLLRRLLMVAAVGVIAVALALGAFRLLLTQLPGYQADLQQWVAAELGLSFEFAAVDARWGLRGPELTFHEASVAGSDTEEPFLFAGRAAITVDPLRFLLDRELTVNTLTFDGTRVTIVHGADGTLRVQGAPVGGPLAAELDVPLPPDVELVVRDSEVVYIDEASQSTWPFADVELSLTREDERLLVELRAQPPEALAARVELSIEGLFNGGDWPDEWRLFSSLRGAELGPLSELVPMPGQRTLEGAGDISLWLDVSGGRPVRATADIALDDVVVTATAPDDVYEQLAMRVEWSADGNAHWQLALSDVTLRRNGREWPSGGNSHIEVRRDSDATLARVDVHSDYLQLEDLRPLVRWLDETPLAQRWLELEPTGVLHELAVRLERIDGAWDYDLSAGFESLGIATTGARPGFRGLSGAARADARSGRIEFASQGGLSLLWPELFAEPVPATRLDGIVVWRLGRNVVRIVSDDLVLGMLDARVESDLELTLPLDGGSPRLDLETVVDGFDVMAAKALLPSQKLPESVAAWLDRAIVAGRVEQLELSFFGALASFPFDGRDGQFRVAADVSSATLEFIQGWPPAVDLDGRVEFLNAGFSARGRGRVLGNYSDDVDVRIADLREPVLELQASTRGELGEVVTFLKSAPLIARQLGPGYERVEARGGLGNVDFELALPLLDMSAFNLRGALEIDDGELAFRGLPAVASEINGRLDLRETAVSAQGIEAIFLDGPITARVAPAAKPGYRATLSAEGETTLDAIARTFDLPFANRLAGQTRWRGELDIPAIADGSAASPVRIAMASNLTGAALRFPAPFEKPPAEPSNLQIEFLFPEGDGMQITGNLGATRRFALELDGASGGYRLRRGAVRFGGEQASLPADAGLSVQGSLPLLDLDEWLALSGGSGLPSAGSLELDTDLELAELFVFGQRLGTSRFNARRGSEAWQIELDSEAVAGTVRVPLGSEPGQPIVADMSRLYLSRGDGGALEVDPRSLPGLSLRAAEFGLGERHLGAVSAELEPDPMGLRLVSFESANEHLSIAGTGSWLSESDEVTTRLALSMTSTDVAAALEVLGFDPVIDGEVADVTASVHWPGPPGSGWLDHVNGDVAVRVETGSMLDLDPGAGRVVGLMSIAALPRRLALDFRDVFNKGLVFDEISGDFTLVDGNAYTDNLKLTGPGAEIGIVGRTGLRDHDYEQQAIVTAEPGNILPTVGGLLGGPGVGAALLIFTRIFKDTLRGIGQAAYCIKGSWDSPTVERLTAPELEQGTLCAALPPSDLTARQAVD